MKKFTIGNKENLGNFYLRGLSGFQMSAKSLADLDDKMMTSEKLEAARAALRAVIYRIGGKSNPILDLDSDHVMDLGLIKLLDIVDRTAGMINRSWGIVHAR
jgi:hypothetical protein